MKTQHRSSKSESEDKSLWQKTPVANLVRYKASGVYFARVRVRGKLIRQSLKTDGFTVAQLRLADLIKEQRQRAETLQTSVRGKMTFGDALTIYEQQLKEAQHLKPAAKLYREKSIKALLRSWPELKDTDVRKISAHDCLHWASRFARDYSPTVFNNTVGTLRHVLKIAIQSGARYGNPADEIKKVKVRQKVLQLPEHNQFLSLVASVREAGGRFSHDCGDLVEFFAYSGARKSEAARVFGGDCDFANGKIAIKGDPETGTKNWEIRTLPMIPDMRRLLERIKGERNKADFLNSPVMRVHECQKAIDSACKKLGLTRFTHHDLRHLFATRCIESGVDIPTVSRWLGHRDGGALAMKTYGHLRDQHSTSMAQKVIFSEPVEATPTNIVALPSVQAPPARPAQNDASAKKDVAKAKAKYKYPWWASNDPLEVFWGQVNEPCQIVPLKKYLDAARVAMDRVVFQNEFDDPQGLIDEFGELVTTETLERLSAKLQRRNRSGAEKGQNEANS